ncbi:hypothetical protein [Enterobacter phage 01_vB_Eclo_IJM]|nr:hypothetical protein [Enterobacter phage 01_vB_Eclo_IJM]
MITRMSSVGYWSLRQSMLPDTLYWFPDRSTT